MDQSTDPTARRRGKYEGYALVTESDIDRTGWYEGRGPDVLKVHARVFRIPSKREFVLRNFSNATAQERAEADRLLHLMPRLFERWEADGRANKWRHRTHGYWYWTVGIRSILDDPTVLLEAEFAHIDLSSEAAA